MKNLENFGILELDARKMKSIDGGRNSHGHTGIGDFLRSLNIVVFGVVIKEGYYCE